MHNCTLIILNFVFTIVFSRVLFSLFSCWVSGWGKNDFTTGTYQTIQKQVDVPILSSSTCQSALSATRLGPSFLFDHSAFICAGGEIGKDACTVSRIDSKILYMWVELWTLKCVANWAITGWWWFAARVPNEWTIFSCWSSCMGHWLCRYQHSRCLCECSNLSSMDSDNIGNTIIMSQIQINIIFFIKHTKQDFPYEWR